MQGMACSHVSVRGHETGAQLVVWGNGGKPESEDPSLDWIPAQMPVRGTSGAARDGHQDGRSKRENEEITLR